MSPVLRSLRPGLVAALVLLAPGAWAQADASSCLPLADAARLACYDRVHGRPAAAPAAAASATDAAAPAPSSVPTSTSVFDDRWDLDGRRPGELFVPRPYKPVYLMPGTWTDRVNRAPSSPAPGHSVSSPLDLRSAEAKYQISFKSKVWENVLGTPGTLWAAYTQSSRWQVYSSSASRPFRETNYEPEILFGWPLQAEWMGWRLRHGAVSLNHQSNGRTLPLSRSWNRIVGELRFERGDWTAELRPWWRIDEDASDDDNADIEDYVGRAELLLTRQWGEHVVALQLRHSLRGGDRSRGSGQVEWAFPLDGALRGYLQWFSGYGESLIDYNLRQNKLGIGILIVGWR